MKQLTQQILIEDVLEYNNLEVPKQVVKSIVEFLNSDSMMLVYENNQLTEHDHIRRNSNHSIINESGNTITMQSLLKADLQDFQVHEADNLDEVAAFNHIPKTRLVHEHSSVFMLPENYQNHLEDISKTLNSLIVFLKYNNIAEDYSVNIADELSVLQDFNKL